MYEHLPRSLEFNLILLARRANKTANIKYDGQFAFMEKQNDTKYLPVHARITKIDVALSDFSGGFNI